MGSLTALYGAIVIGWIAYEHYEPILLVQFNFTQFTVGLAIAQAVILTITPPLAGKLGDRYRLSSGHRFPGYSCRYPGRLTKRHQQQNSFGWNADYLGGAFTAFQQPCKLLRIEEILSDQFFALSDQHAGIFLITIPLLVLLWLVLFAIGFAALSVCSLPLAMEKSGYSQKVFCVGIFFAGVALPDEILEVLQLIQLE